MLDVVAHKDFAHGSKHDQYMKWEIFGTFKLFHYSATISNNIFYNIIMYVG